jgi:hypothetical protein
MKLKFYIFKIALVLLYVVLFKSAEAQVQGTVFRDMNNNGIQDLVNPSEPGEYGVSIKAYNAANILMASTSTNPAGKYNFSAAQIPAGTAVRLEFTETAGDYPSKRIAADRTNIQFVIAGAGALNIDYAIATKKFLSDNSNPYVATTASTNGDPLATGAGNAGDNNNLYIFPYDLSSDGGSTRRAKNQYLGSVFGLAWQRESRTLMIAAYLKRHAGFGPGGIGAIYQSQVSVAGIPSTPSLLLDVNALGINVGTDPRINPLPGASNMPNTDIGVFAEVGKRGIGGMELADNGRDLYIVNMYQKKLHRINIGNPLKSSFSAADVTGTWTIPDPGIAGTQWHPMALKMHNGKMYVGGICTKEVITAHNIADTANLSGVVYEFDIASNTFTQVLRFPLSHRKGYTNADYRYEFRNNYWSAWQNNGDISISGPIRSGLIGATTGNNATGLYYAQPLFSALEFDVDGAMIIGLRDRFGDQGGYANYFETGNVPGETYRALSAGEVLRAGKSGSSWNIEKAGAVTSAGVTTTTLGATVNNPAMTGSFAGMSGTPWGGSYGPGGAYYYYNQNFDNTGVPAPFNSGSNVTGHYLKTNGGLAFLPGYNEMITSAIDPVNKSFTNGVIKNYSLGANAGNMSGRMELIQSASGDPSNMGKAAALGDLELLLDAEAGEIGNRVWNDLNGNGRQDADEPGLSGVVVVLRSPGMDNVYNTGDDQTWTVTTDANGNYFFDATIVNDNRRPAQWIGVSSTNSGILPGFEYKLEINGVQAPLAGMILSAAHAVSDEIDNDGVYNVTNVEFIFNPGGSTAPNSSFDNNYNIDFGFTSNSLLPYTKLNLSAALANNNVKLNWDTKDELNVVKYIIERSADGIHFASTGDARSKGNGSFVYSFIDNLEGISSTKIYYRIRVEEVGGKFRYSDIVNVTINLTGKLAITPNPFTTYVHIQIMAAKKSMADLRIINASGQVMYCNKVLLNEGQNSLSLDGLGGLSKGLYFLELQTGNTVSREKILKQ